MLRFYAFLGALAVIAASKCPSSPIEPRPPALPLAKAEVAKDATNAGRVQSIAVNPTDGRHAIIAMEFGGLWKTHGSGNAWFHIGTLPAVFVTDVEFGADGKTVVAAVFRDNKSINGGGIYVSRTSGDFWAQPATGMVPTSNRTPARTSAYSVSRAPDERGLWYVGTDYGVAISRDDGATWAHVSLEAPVLSPVGVGAAPLEGDRQQDAAQCVLAMPGGRALAMTRSAVYRSDNRGATWRKVIVDNFQHEGPGGGEPGRGNNKMDRSPYAPWAFIFKDYRWNPNGGTLWFYELDTETKTPLPLPQGRWRGPFVRVSKDEVFGGKHITVWVGSGWDGFFVTRDTVDGIRSIRADAEHDDWVSFIAPAGIHADMGDMGVDGDGRPAFFGSDGGIFKPDPNKRGRLASAALPGSGMNSLLITDLAGTNVVGSDGKIKTTLYFTTQDNRIWASPDGGQTWPHNDRQEGYGLEVRPDARAGEAVTVAYVAIGEHDQRERFSDALLANSRPVPNVNQDGQTLDGMDRAFFLSRQDSTTPKPSFWVRLRKLTDAPGREVYVSGNSGESWRKTGNLNFEPAGEIVRTAGGVVAWVPVNTGGAKPRIGLVPLTPTVGFFNNTVHTYDDSDLVRLPGDGSLGRRATMFDSHAVFGVHPLDWKYLIAPDIISNNVKVSRDGGNTWRVDVGLTKQVLRGGELQLSDGSGYRLEVTEIAFDPYFHPEYGNRIFVGTRDAGIICSANDGRSWRTVLYSDRIKYITGFHFLPNGGVY
ncbi:MAG TPA: hypothetical protein VJT74_11235, partial [Pyrinomonadaceae bacterium]|nr:hypothetical protein [Pyrinomonadaceae bacterium]